MSYIQPMTIKKFQRILPILSSPRVCAFFPLRTKFSKFSHFSPGFFWNFHISEPKWKKLQNKEPAHVSSVRLHPILWAGVGSYAVVTVLFVPVLVMEMSESAAGKKERTSTWYMKLLEGRARKINGWRALASDATKTNYHGAQ